MRAPTWLVPENEQTRVLILGAVVGVVAGITTGLFDFLLVLVGRLALGTPDPAVDAVPIAARLLVPPLGGLAAGLLLYRVGRMRGIADVIEALHQKDGRLSGREGGATAIAAALVVGTGHSAGREGPIVQLAASVASRICDLARVSPRRARELVAAGAAAGIAASFNTPLGGVFFAMEVLLGSFALEAFAPVVVATVCGTVVGQVLLGDRLALSLPPYAVSHPAELVLYLLLGVPCAAVAVGFRELLVRLPRLLERSGLPAWAWPAISGLFVGILATVGLQAVMGNGYAFVEQLIRGEAGSAGFLVLVLVARLLTSATSFASRSGAGIFAPTLVIGALTGTIFGTGAHALLPDLVGSPGAYGTVAMGAVTAAVAHSPITMALMLFEMTGNYEVILPLLLTLAVSGLVARRTHPRSVYLQTLADRGVRLDRGREELVLFDLHVADIMREDFVVVAYDAPFSTLADRFLHQRVDEVHVVDHDGRLRGVVDIQDVKHLLSGDGKPVRELVVPSPAVGPDDPLAAAMPRYFKTGLSTLPVVDDDERLVGVLHERDVVGALDREVLRQETLMARIESTDDEGRHVDFFELPEGHVIAAVEVMGQLQGHTLAELRLPRRYGVTVLAVDVRDGVGNLQREPARADLRLAEGDRIVVVGPAADVAALASAEADFEETVEVGRTEAVEARKT